MWFGLGALKLLTGQIGRSPLQVAALIPPKTGLTAGFDRQCIIILQYKLTLKLSCCISHTPTGPNDPSSESMEFRKWLDPIALSKGLSRGVLEQSISSYWTLNEMSEMIDQPEKTRDDIFSEQIDNAFAPLDQSALDGFHRCIGPVEEHRRAHRHN